ncbi:response regulator transcription factor [Streptococcus dentapri]|uniref:Response regulator transcription factor n=1 Tax=Streptococcus dentapri TaxID=573564 RepID=A0ABV8CZJ4_9STRE
MKLLIVEDERDLNLSLAKLLKTHSYSVDSAFDGKEGMDFLAVSDYDVIILDIMMPKMDGYAFIQELRHSGSKIPVLVLTAKDTVEDKITGLDLGADDYLVKPFEFGELLARLRAMLRRDNREVLTSTIQLGSVTVDLAGHHVSKNGQAVDLTAKEYEVMEFLARNPGVVMSRDKIREHVWDYDYEGDSNIIDVLIKNIRRKLDENSKDSLIQTKRGLGYVIYK